MVESEVKEEFVKHMATTLDWGALRKAASEVSTNFASKLPTPQHELLKFPRAVLPCFLRGILRVLGFISLPARARTRFVFQAGATETPVRFGRPCSIFAIYSELNHTIVGDIDSSFS